MVDIFSTHRNLNNGNMSANTEYFGIGVYILAFLHFTKFLYFAYCF